jgi:hypothetical protein
MTALLRLVGPAVARYFDPGPDDLLDTFFDDTPMPVTVEVYPFLPATRITGQTLLINGAARAFTGVSGQNPTWLQFTLGGDPGEVVGGINTVTLSVTDDAGSTTPFSLRYFRLATRPTATSTIHPTYKKAAPSKTPPRTTVKKSGAVAPTGREPVTAADAGGRGATGPAGNGAGPAS